MPRARCRAAKFYISCSPATAARCLRRSAKRLRSTAVQGCEYLLTCPASAVPNQISAGDRLQAPIGLLSALNQRRKRKTQRFPFRSRKKSTLTSGAPRRRSFFGLISELMRRYGADGPGQDRTSTAPGTAKNYISCGEQQSPSSSGRCAGPAAIHVVVGTVFCLFNSDEHPAWKGSRRYAMPVSDLSAFKAGSSRPGSMNSRKISYGFRQTGYTLSGPARACSAEAGRF